MSVEGLASILRERELAIVGTFGPQGVRIPGEFVLLESSQICTLTILKVYLSPINVWSNFQ